MQGAFGLLTDTEAHIEQYCKTCCTARTIVPVVISDINFYYLQL
jgi:hypothetical protein